MRLDHAIEHLTGIRPLLSAETNEALDKVLEPYREHGGHVPEWRMVQEVIDEMDSCQKCKRQGCEFRDKRKIRINCPLWKESAV